MIERRVEMQIDLHDTVAAVDRMERRYDGVVLIVVLAVIADRRTVVAGVQVLIDRIFRCRPNGEMQGEDRVDVLRAGFIHCIDIHAATPDILTAPNDRVAFAGR